MSNLSRGRSVRIFLVNGSPTGLRTAEMGNWTGVALGCPISDLDQLRNRPEAQKTGVYFLIGPPETNAEGPKVYVGEADVVLKRLAKHAADVEKQWCSSCIFITSKDTHLTKAHARWLESSLVEELKRAKRCKVMNGVTPTPKNLPEADICDMAEFLENLRCLVGMLGLDVFEGTAPQPSGERGFESVDRNAHDLSLEMSGEEFRATCIVRDGKFWVQPGSLAKAQLRNHAGGDLIAIREMLLRKGILAPLEAGGASLRFAQQYPFDSPSGAARVIAGGATNGRKVWRIQGTDQSYGAWQDARLPASPGPDLNASEPDDDDGDDAIN